MPMKNSLKNKDGHKIVKIMDFLGMFSHAYSIRVSLQYGKVLLKITSRNVPSKNPLKLGISILGPNLTIFGGKGTHHIS